MKMMIRYRDEYRRWQAEHDALAPKAGDMAPDFELRDANGQHTVKLSDFRDREPVVLVFGSLT